MKTGTKIIGLLLSVVMLVSLLGLFSLTASAAAAELTAEITGADGNPASVTLKDSDADSYYDIGTADELYAFAAAVNGGNTAINGELTANIVVNENVLTAEGKLNGDGSDFRVWIPIGNENNSYSGSFNGQNHTVSGVYLNDSNTHTSGFFGYVSGGSVKNVSVVDSYFNASSRVGGVVGYIYGTVENCNNEGTVNGRFYVGGVVGENNGTVENCHNKGAVSSSVYVGGVVGENDRTVINCYNTGTIGGNFSVAGGVVGENYGTVTNCYSAGTVIEGGTISNVGGVAGIIQENSTVTNCYYDNTVCSGGSVGLNYDGIVTDVFGKTTEEFASGEVACMLQGEQTEQVWGQIIGSDIYPVFAAESNKVYSALNCHNDITYSNTQQEDGHHTGGTATCQTQAVCEVCGASYGELDPNNHEYEKNNGICCDTYQPAIDSNSDGVYEISNAGQLFWFANYVNTVDRTASAVLVADIDLENRPWTPIGSTGEDSNNFRGVFDGQNHTIKGLYVEGGRAGLGFFGEVRTGTVKNFTIYGEVVVNTEVDYVGGVIGSICGLNGENDLYRNGAIIQNITSYVNLTATAHGVGMIGGFVGYANHQSLIENCSWYGTFDAGIYRVDSGAGGFIGKIQENTSEVTIRNCAAYGTIKTNYEKNSFNDTPTIYMGGFLSFSNTGAKTVLENCLFAGKFERGENLTDQARLGAFGTLRSVNAIKNCYYLGEDGLAAVHSDSNLKPGSDNVEITSVTGAQLLSGEVAYKLGEHFGQILEGENRQSYPVLGETKVEDFQRFEIYGQQLGIGADLSMKYYVMGYAPQFNSKRLYMEFSLGGVKTKVYADEPNADGFYVFVLEGINPQCMGDSIRAMLYYNETEVTSHGCEDGKEYSVEKNLLNLLEKYKDDAALAALIKDTLAYGDAASAFTGHQTMTGNTYTENSSNREIPVSEADRFEIEPNMPLVEQYTVRFGTTLSIKIKVSYLPMSRVYVNGKEYVTTEEDVNRGYIIFESDPISATDFDKDFSAIIQNDQGENHSYIHVSVNDYLYAISQSSTNEKMVNLAKALYNYGYSAKVYNHVKTGEGEHTYNAYIDNSDGTHNKACACGEEVTENHRFDEQGNCACGDSVTPVSDLDELKAAVEQGGKILLTESIDVSSEEVGLYISTDITVYLNGKTLTGDPSIFNVLRGATLTILGDGTLSVPVENCAIAILNGTVNIAGGVLEGFILTDGNGKLNIRDGQVLDVRVQGGICTVSGGEISYLYNSGICTVTGGTFGFDPTEYVDTENYTVTNNGDGTWTVTAK